jgi:hypothetical protein
MEVARSLKLTKVITHTRMHKYPPPPEARWLGLLLLLLAAALDMATTALFPFVANDDGRPTNRPTETQLYRRRFAFFRLCFLLAVVEKTGGNVNTALLAAAAAASFRLCFVYKMAVDASIGRSTGTNFDGIGFGWLLLLSWCGMC